jgi:hypothetical protein
MVIKPLLNSVKLLLKSNDAIKYIVTQESYENQPYHARQISCVTRFLRHTHSARLSFDKPANVVRTFILKNNFAIVNFLGHGFQKGQRIEDKILSKQIQLVEFQFFIGRILY